MSGTTRVSWYQKKHSPTTLIVVINHPYLLIHWLHICTGTNMYTCATCNGYRIHATSTNKWLPSLWTCYLYITTFLVYPLLTTRSQRWSVICCVWPWTMTYQKFLLWISSQGQDLYLHQKLNMCILLVLIWEQLQTQSDDHDDDDDNARCHSTTTRVTYRQLVHCIELLPTPLRQTPHGHLAAFCISVCYTPDIITLVLFILFLVPLFSTLSFHSTADINHVVHYQCYHFAQNAIKTFFPNPQSQSIACG